MSCLCCSQTTSNIFDVASHANCLGSWFGGASSSYPFHNAVWKYGRLQRCLKAGDVDGRLHNFWGMSTFADNLSCRFKVVALPIVPIYAVMSHSVRACTVNIFGMTPACCCIMTFTSMSLWLTSRLPPSPIHWQANYSFVSGYDAWV